VLAQVAVNIVIIPVIILEINPKYGSDYLIISLLQLTDGIFLDHGVGEPRGE